ncbi:MAG TPA: ABC transporter ATP-binding protein [Candidatus Blautia intestinigallinarum]|nr:ABC transporter ATP-binding protein [Candidatus Blautia intestinigallinarum]
MLKLENVRKQYPNFQLDCSLEVKDGCVTGLIGQNGAGKTTTFKSILNLIYPEGGRIVLFGKDVRQMTPQDKAQVGVVLSESGFYDGLNPRQISKVMGKMYENFSEQEFLEFCRRFELPLDKKIRDYSTGMRVKLKVLCAFAHHPKFLILDEPTAGLDVVAREEILDMLREYMEEGEQSILISSHISSDLEGFCDDLYLIQEGKIVLHEETDVLLSEYALLKVSEEQYRDLEKQYLLYRKKENYGYSCLTREKQFYLENYPKIVVEAGSVDKVMMMVVKGERI